MTNEENSEERSIQKLDVYAPTFSHWKEEIKCLSRCPVHTDARAYIQAIEREDYEEAYLIARAPNPLASICGRICGSPCELACRRGELDAPLAIRALKRIITEEYAFKSDIRPGLEAKKRRERLIARFSKYRSGSVTDVAALAERAKKDEVAPLSIGIIGSGPGGLACAHDLAVLGHDPVIYEMERVPAGMLFLGVPAYRLPRDVILAEIDLIRMMGVEIRTGVQVGKDIQLKELFESHDAVVIGVGAKRSRTLPIPGAQAEGVLGAVEFLRAVSLGDDLRIGQEIVVVGGGNVAYDVSRTALRNTEEDVARSAIRQPFVRKVTMACLEALDEMPADVIEIEEADEEGVDRHNRLGPKEILVDENGHVRGVLFQRVLSVFNEEGRFAPVFDSEDVVEIPADTVILAVGQSPDLSFIPEEENVALGKNGLPVLNDELETTRSDLYVVGDVVLGPQLMIDAIATGKRVALAIHGKAVGKKLGVESEFHFEEVSKYRRSSDYEVKPRTSLPVVSADRRVSGGVLETVEIGYNRALAENESERCLDCAVSPIFNSDRCILCAGCVDVCPHDCLSLVSLEKIRQTPELEEIFIERYGESQELSEIEGAAIVKDKESTCIRCGICAQRCPVGAITMERFVFEEAIA